MKLIIFYIFIFLTNNLQSKIYEILGTSEKLSQEAKQKNNEWKKEIYNFAKHFPKQFFLNGQSDEKVVALTFDDGPDNKVTPKILETLNKHNIKGNFFFLGERLEKNKEIVKKAYIEGHLILNHSWDHKKLTSLNPKIIKHEIVSTENKIFEIIGKKPALFRPPYGAVNNKVITEILKTNNKIIFWSIDTYDWSVMNAQKISDNVINNIRPGDIILMHSNENKIETSKALGTIIKELQLQGYKFVTLDKLLNINAYK